MKSTESKQKLFTYWRTRYQVEPYNRTLQELLTAAFERTNIGDRQRSPSEDYFQYINSRTKMNGFFCADFIAHEINSTGRIVAQRPDRDSVEVEAIPPGKAADGAPREYLDGNLFLVCKGNHLLLAQDRHLIAKHLEGYLNDMLYNLPCNFPESQAIILERAIPRETKKKITKGFSTLKLSAPLNYKQKIVVVDEQKKEVRSVPFGKTWDVITSIFPPSMKDRLASDGVTDPKEIELSIELKWKKRGRNEKQSDQMDMLATTFRHVEDEFTFEARTTDGEVLKKDELRLQKLTSVRHRNNLPQRDDIFEKLINWFYDLNNKGSI